LAGTIAGTTLRVFNVAGAVDGYVDTDTARIIPNIIRAARGELPSVSLNGDGSAVREFAHVVDVASAFRLAMEADHSGHATFNVGTGKGVSIRDVVATAEEVTGRTIPVEHLPPKDEPHTLISDPEKIRRRLGWEPAHSKLSEILKSAYEGRFG
jgi:UDP-glucose 4-epimerase